MSEEYKVKMSSQAMATMALVFQKCIGEQMHIDDVLGEIEFVIADYERKDGVLEEGVLVATNPPHISLNKLKFDDLEE